MPPEGQPRNRVWTVNDLNDGGGPGLAALAASSASEGSGGDGGGGGGGGGGEGAGAPLHLTSCYHIPNLPHADQAKMLLQRVVREFEGIVKDRGYNVLSVSELCCCGDGLDFRPGPSRRRKLRKQPDNIWGYNQWTSRGGKFGESTIHLRLRHPSDHSKLLLYEDVAGTMAHELAHCEHRPHNDKFFKLMDDILEQHAVLMASGLSRNGGYTMPAFGGSGRALGGGIGGGIGARVANTGGGPRPTPAQVREARLRHWQQQQQRHNPGSQATGTTGGGHKLGGDNLFTQWMTPAEAAVVAAEARRRMQQLRLRGDRCCRPVTVDADSDVEEGSGSVEVEEGRDGAVTNGGQDATAEGGESEERTNEEDSGGLGDERKPAAVDPTFKHPFQSSIRRGNRLATDPAESTASKRPRGITKEAVRSDASNADEENVKPSATLIPNAPGAEVIDLTGDDDEINGAVAATARSSSGERAQRRRGERLLPWTCRRCTYVNDPVAARAPATCAVCDAPRFATDPENPTTRAIRLRLYK